MKMKWIYVMMIALLFTACQDEKDVIDIPGEEQNEEVETTPVNLSFKTYAAVGTEGKTFGEVEYYKPVKEVELYLFDSNGLFYDHFTIPVAKNYNYVYTSTQQVSLPKGNWYIYAIIHKPNNFLQEPTTGTTIDEFEQQTVEVGIGDNYEGWITRYLPIMLTLSRELKTIGLSSNSPEQIHLEVGHLLSKVEVNQKDKPIMGKDVKGNFVGGATDGLIRYCISNEPKQVFLIGQWSGTFLQSQVLSPHFYNCVPEVDFYKPFYTYTSMSNYWYAVENTNQNPNYKNSSSFVLQFIYEPHRDELYDKQHKPGATTFKGSNGKSFWMAEYSNGTKLLYNDEPKNLEHPELGFPVRTSEYDNGECYYRVPVADNTETIPSRIYGLIRNHYYYLTVKSISSLGNHTYTNWDDTEPPLGEEKEIDIEINMIDWVPYEIPVELD